MTDIMEGLRFGLLQVIAQAPSKKGKAGKRYYCLCDCGNAKIVRKDALKVKDLMKVKSCGCSRSFIQNLKRTKHGMSNSRLFNIWSGIKQRTGNPNDPNYPRYGGRGVTMCSEWRGSFISFAEWSLANGYMKDLTIDRIDNDGNYSPNNCRWVSRTEQARNTSMNVLTHDLARSIKSMASNGMNNNEIAKDLGLTNQQVRSVTRGAAWRNI